MTALEERRIKVLLKDAVVEVLEERRDLLREALQEGLEDMAMLKAIRNLDYVVLLCSDMQAMKAFYHDVMGFPVYRDWGEWYEMRVGATLLSMIARGVRLDVHWCVLSGVGDREREAAAQFPLGSLQSIIPW